MTPFSIGVILGELLVEDDRQQLIKEVLEGFLTVPNHILQHVLEKLEGLPNGSQKDPLDGGILLNREQPELLFSLASRPNAVDLSTFLYTLLTPPPNSDAPLNVVLVYAGLIAEGSGHWILSNYVFNPTALIDEMDKMIAAYPKTVDAEDHSPTRRINLHLGLGGVRSGGEWRQLLSHQFAPLAGRSIHVTVNGSHVTPHLKPSSGDDIISRSDISALHDLLTDIFTELPEVYCPPLADPIFPSQPGNPTLRVGRPSLYVFPEGSGQSAILTLPGYSMLIDGGCGHRPCFWPVATHLDRLDSVFITHWGVDNLLGLRSILPVAFASASNDSASGPILCLLTPPPNPLTTLAAPDDTHTRSHFSLSLPREVSQLFNHIKRSGTNVIAHPLLRGSKMSVSSQSIQLYHKVGQGTLDLLPLTPADDDSAEIRKTSDDWSRSSPSLMTTTANLGKPGPTNKSSIPLLSHTSVSALVIWRPAHDTEPILRILFVPSNAHQTRVLVSLEAVAAANIFLRHHRAVPVDFERKRPVNPAARRSNMPPVTKTASLNSVDTSGVAPSTKRSLPGAKKTEVPAHPRSAKATPSNRPDSSKGALKTKSPLIPVEAVEHADQLKPVLPAIPGNTQSHELDANVLRNGCSNGYHHDESEKLSSVLNQVALNEDALDPDCSTASDSNLIPQSQDPIAVWGIPQGLPPPIPPTGSLVNGKSNAANKSAPSRRVTSAGTSRPNLIPRSARPNGSVSINTYTPHAGYTDASAHTVGVGAVRLPPYDKVKPVYLDVAFVPGGGNPHLVDAEWFKRVRARFYVATDPKPSAGFMESLVVGKESWTGDDAKIPVSVIFAHESEDLLIWLGKHAGRLAACSVDVSAIASRSNIQLLSDSPSNGSSVGVGHPLSCSGYRIDL